ncbi:MAG: excinuclease ABC subunit UvrC [Acidimicrobiia bacterium]|nr:excinuclease ABC subunit UvrC [Acidimicrobiia bacterium]
MDAIDSKEIPTSPGCYQFFSNDNEILYVGKAKNLRNRVSSYFKDGPKSNPRINQMVEIANRVEWISVENETQALLLEYSYIQQHKPRYNVRLKDDKSYPWLAITLNEKWPKAFMYRGKQRKGVKYFGPYTSVYAIREILDTLINIFPVRTCNTAKFNDYKRRGRGCLLYDIGKCSAPCVDTITKEQYDLYIDGLIKFLNGETNDVKQSMIDEMNQSVEKQLYEKAATLRDRISMLDTIVERQQIYGAQRDNFDVVAYASDGIEICVEVLRIRSGRVMGNRKFILEPGEVLADDPLIEQVLLRLYENQLPEVLPNKILLQELPKSKESYEKLLSNLRNDNVKLVEPIKGSKKNLLNIAIENAQHALDSRIKTRINDIEQRTNALNELRTQLNLDRVPMRIECFDISHIQGTNTVASMVVLDDGLPKKNDYRHFVINHDQGNNDFLSMEEAITRRFKNYDSDDVSFSILPDLLVIDGGKGQLSSTMRALKSLNLSNRFDVVSLAKKEEEVFIKGQSESVMIPRNSLALMLLRLIRDESHRFAITHHRAKRSKSMTLSVLDDVRGLGESRRKQLFHSFGSIKKLREQSKETLMSIPYLPEKVALELYDKLHEEL